MNKLLTCSFCGRDRWDVEMLIKGLDEAYICNECIDICNQIVAEHKIRDMQEEITREAFLELWGSD